MKPETVLFLRKLAREATIFALLGMVVAGIGMFVVIDNADRTNAREKAAEAVHADVKWFPQPKPTPTVEVPLTNGTVLHVRQCLVPPPASLGGDCLNFSGPFAQYELQIQAVPAPPTGELQSPNPATQDPAGLAKAPFRSRLIGSVPLGSADQVGIEKEYWTAYKNSRHQRPVEEMLGPLLFGLCGFAAGLVLWIFYRLVRFAVKG